jgi:hypothetical protein
LNGPSVLDATTLLEQLRTRHGDSFGPGQLRTLQRRIHHWRALHGPPKEVFFEQRPEPGREAAFDFTDASELGVTIAGLSFPHLLFEFLLTFSKWRWVSLAFSETFEALLLGLQQALWALGGVPAVWRSDNLSAATHQLPGGGRELTKRYAQLLDHYGAKSTRIEPGESHQNGGAEKAHDLLKSALRQALLLRGSSDFRDSDAYVHFVRQVARKLQSDKQAERLADEQSRLLPLPSARLPDYSCYKAVVRRWSTIHFAKHTYSVPSRLIDHEVDIRQYADVIDVYYRDQLAARMPRIRGEQPHRIDYRHVIWSLVRKPGAFARYKYREELFPSTVFRRTYDALVKARGEPADVEYVRVLHLAASSLEVDVENVLTTLLSQGKVPHFLAVQALAAPPVSSVPRVHIPPPDLSVYDRLLTAEAS